MKPLVLVLALTAAAATAGASRAAAQTCAGALPGAPAGLPSSIVLQTECGAYSVDGDGNVSTTARKQAPWWSPSPFRLALQRRHVVLIEQGRVRWRSHRVFDLALEDLASIAVSDRDLAFSFMHGKLWVSRLDGREHAVAAGEHALAWTKNDDLLTVRRHHGRFDLRVRRENGSRPRLLVRAPLRFVVDEEMGSLLYVTPARVLVRTDGRSSSMLADLSRLGFGRTFELQPLPRGLLAIFTPRRVAVVRSDGSLYATADYPAAPGLRYGYPTFGVGANGVAVAVDLWSESLHEREDVFVLRAGDSEATRVLSEAAEFAGGCGWYARLEWKGDWLLYTDALTNVVALDSVTGRRVDLTATALHLPGVTPDPSGNGETGFEFAVWG